MSLIDIEIIIKKGIDIKGRYPYPDIKTGDKIEIGGSADISEIKIAGEKVTAIADKYEKEIGVYDGVRIITSNAAV